MRVPAVLLAALALTSGCAASTYPLNPQLAAQVGLEPPSLSERVAQEPAVAFQQKGACSWYGPGFHGRRTANGETFNTHDLTAAHRTLPFGSRVEVTDKKTGNKVTVRINDRGPYLHGRILDLSYAAASTLGTVGQGVANVELRLVDIEPETTRDEVWAIQVAAFRNKSEANRFLEGLSAQQRQAGLYYVKGPDAEAKDYRVRFGPFGCQKTAKSAASKLENVGLKPALLREELTRAEESPVGSRLIR
jgi:rare lipoprotein A